MTDDLNTTQDTSTPDSSPPTVSEPSNMLPEVPEPPRDDFGAESNNSAINKGDVEISQSENEPKTSENQDSTSAESESIKADKGTAQMGRNEALKSESEPLNPEPRTEKAEATPPPIVQTSQPKISLARELLIKARNMIQFRKRKKLDRVMEMFAKQTKITNDEVEKFLHVSDASAERYLNTLEKENKIKQVGKTGHAVSYTRI